MGAANHISVVIPTIGRAEALKRCLDALAAGKLSPDRFEVVVADDSGGSDVSGTIDGFRDRLRIRAVQAPRTGPSAARNAGLHAAEGNVAAFTDDDCEPAPGWLAALDVALRENRGAAVGGLVRNGRPGNLGAAATQVVADALHEHYSHSADPRFFASNNVAFPAAELAAIGGFADEFRYAEDRELCERWLRSGRRFVYTAEAVVDHMRELSVPEFLRQHYGYGRGAYAFRAGNGAEPWPARAGLLRAVATGALRSPSPRGRPAMVAAIAASQLATAAGFAREALSGGGRP